MQQGGLLVVILVIVLAVWLCLSQKTEGFAGSTMCSSDQFLVCEQGACWCAYHQKCDKVKARRDGRCPKGYKHHERCYGGQACFCYKCDPEGKWIGGR